MRSIFINQPFEGEGHRVGDHLSELLARHGDFDTFQIAVAWARSGGIRPLFDLMRRFRQNGGQIEVVVGIDLNGTSLQALRMFREVAQTVRIFQNAHPRLRPTYHPKLYLFSGPASAAVVLGSSNFTMGGLYVNYEQNIRLDLDLAGNDDRSVLDDIRRGYQASVDAPNGVVRLLTDELLAQLVERRLLVDEAAPAGGRTRNGDQDNQETKEALAPLFGTMEIPPPPLAARGVARGRREAAALGRGAVAPAIATAVGAAANTLTMRPYPARGGTQVQVPQETAAGFFKQIRTVISRHDGRRHPISPARTKSRSGSRRGRVINTLKLEVPECQSIRVPIVQFDKREEMVEYTVFDGENDRQGQQLLQDLQSGLRDGTSQQTRGNSTIWSES
jgi:HKD family nuclease